MEQVSLETARDAAVRLVGAEHARRRAEADKVEALCDLAVAYDLDDEELFLEVLIDQHIQIGGVGTPLVSEMVSLEIAGLLKIPVAHAAAELSAALDLKYRHPRLYEAVLNLEIEVDRAQLMTSRCRDLHPMLLDEITAAWLARQDRLSWGQAKKLIDKLVVQADPELAARKERVAREDRGVWVWGLNEGVMNLTGTLDVLDARFLDARLSEMAGLIAPRFPRLTKAQRRAKAIGVLANPAYALALLQEAAQPELLTDDALAFMAKLLDGVPREFYQPPTGSRATETTAPSEGDEPVDETRVPVDPDGDQWQLTDRDLHPRGVGQPPPPYHHGRAGDLPRRLAHPDGTPCTGLLSCSHESVDGARALVPGEGSARCLGHDACTVGEGSAHPPGECATRRHRHSQSYACVETRNYSEVNEDCCCPDLPRTRRLDPHECAGHHCGTIQVPVAKLRPTLGIAVHIHSDALGQLDPAARVEKAGTITTTLLAELLGEGNGYNLKVQPVIDLPNLEPADNYVPSAQLRRGMVLAFPNEPFPFSPRDSVGLDLDHTIAYQPGRPGQTRVGNLAPLTRRVHRAKTAGYWVMHQPTPGRIEWRSPLGCRYDVTPFGVERCHPIHYNPDHDHGGAEAGDTAVSEHPRR